MHIIDAGIGASLLLKTPLSWRKISFFRDDSVGPDFTLRGEEISGAGSQPVGGIHEFHELRQVLHFVLDYVDRYG